MARRWVESLMNPGPYVRQLRINASAADEHYLEDRLLDASDSHIRAVAARILRQIPESRLVERMIVLCRRYITPAQNGFIIDLSLNYTNTMKRDGIQRDNPAFSSNQAWWLAQALGCVPVSYWLNCWNLTLAELLRMTEATPYHQEVLWEGWIASALLHEDVDFAAVLYERQPFQRRLLRLLATDIHVIEVIALDEITGSLTNRTLLLLRQIQQLWSAELTHTFLAHLPLDAPPSEVMVRCLPVFARYMTLDAVEVLQTIDEPDWQEVVAAALDMLHFRVAMVEAVQQ
jgi:hypothetical protein